MNNMTPAQHAELISEQAKREIKAKYLKGAEEHGGKIWEIPLPVLLASGIEESDDQGVYLRTMRQQLTELKSLITSLFELLEHPLEEPLDNETADLMEQISFILGLS